MAEVLARAHPLAGRAAASAGVAITPAGPATRISLRAPERSRSELSKALKVLLTDGPGQIRTLGPRMVMPLGPDEWLVIDEEGADLAAACRKVAAPHSAVDVSHRNTAILLIGTRAEDVLNAGCPLDLSMDAFPIGRATRTVLGKVEIVLVRIAAETFRVEVWRSFSDYAFSFLAAAARDAES